MTPAQDATTLADQRAADILMEQLDALGAHITYTACKAIVSKLRATSQTPDTVQAMLEPRRSEQEHRRYLDASRRADTYRKERDTWKAAAEAEAAIGKELLIRAEKAEAALSTPLRIRRPAEDGANMTPAQDATTLADELAKWLHDETNHPESYPSHTWPETERDDGQREGGFVKIVPLHGQEYFRDIARRLIARFAALRSTPPSPVREALQACWDEISNSRQRSGDDHDSGLVLACAMIARRISRLPVSTPSASAGPKAEAVYVKKTVKALREPVDSAGCDPLMLEAANLIETLYLASLAAHPQPQQADGRGAVIEECAKVAEGAFEVKKYIGRMVAAKIRALQQSPATDNAPETK